MKYVGLTVVLLSAFVFTACEQPKEEQTAEEPAAEVPKEASESASSGVHKGEPPSANQPQPVYPDGG
jgi:hypothetical protein